ncbi:MAG: hypothetical protein GY810_12370 [Aureispira sp.]|nr:hypothetical protein [Aureispira sp.]
MNRNYLNISITLVILLAVLLYYITPTQKERVTNKRLAKKASWELSIEGRIGCFYTELEDVLVIRNIRHNGLKGIEKASGIKKWEYIFEVKEGNKVLELAPNILCVFDKGKNRIMRLDPLTGKELWSYDKGSGGSEDTTLIWGDKHQMAWVEVMDNTIKYINNVILLDIETGALDAKYYYN